MAERLAMRHTTDGLDVDAICSTEDQFEAKLRMLPGMQDADLLDKVVLVRVDHNVVKKGVIHDYYRVDATLGTLFSIVERGGRPILMTHVGRPRNKTDGTINVDEHTSVQPVVDYLERKLHTKFVVPAVRKNDYGIPALDTSINLLLKDLRSRKIGGIYLPNTRWFTGEESKGEEKDDFARQLAGLADIFVNDAFGSWQAHVSTVGITKHLPSYAGYLMQEEIKGISAIINPQRPFLAVVAGSKFDTKVQTLTAIHKRVDHLVLGGVVYNAYVCAKYNVRMKGVSEADVEAARDLVKQDEALEASKIVPLRYVVESSLPNGQREDGEASTHHVTGCCCKSDYDYVVDVAPESFDHPEIQEVFSNAKTIFVNAVMGFMPSFYEGTQALDLAIHRNKTAVKMYGGGDTLQELKNLTPGLYMEAIASTGYYFFTGGGTVLKAIESGDPFDLPPVKALLEHTDRIFE